ncbi:hypothetical protein [Mesorhizobium loti]|uniref:hypothetical protein n=1 Tax=Rhizobium loti TaxID=381 RepID=UPI00042752BB|nr:hypothetical protein [Mesorhizobium loti]
MATFNRSAAISRGHQLYTSSRTLKDLAATHAANNSYSSRGKPCTWPAEPGNWLTSNSIRLAKVDKEQPADWDIWIGARLAAANDNAPPRRSVPQENDGPDADYHERQASPGTSRDYEGDIPSRLLAENDLESYFVLRAVRALMSPAGLLAANDNSAEDADVEMDDGFGLDYALDQDEAGDVVEQYCATGRLPNGTFKFRQRSGAGGCKLAAEHRKREKEGRHVDRYLMLRGVATLPPQEYTSDGETPWWRSHAPKNAKALVDLAEACDRTDWSRVTWTRYAALPARVYGALGICSEMTGSGEGKTTASAHDTTHELCRRAAEKEFRARLPERFLRIIDAALERKGYGAIGEAERISGNGAKNAVKTALREAWHVLSDITEEKLPEFEKKLAA